MGCLEGLGRKYLLKAGWDEMAWGGIEGIACIVLESFE